ncbi:SlyX family protein [Georhizobium sp. MAB10]|uniref:SlyX family protein n=1 Tax=Georhizobium sp. MAB10 TaxID=3028319 RepID=UPI003855EEE5
MSAELENRLTTLEELAAHQAKTIEDLSDELARQYQVTDRLTRQVEAIAQRFLALEEQSHGPVPVTKPPHY